MPRVPSKPSSRRRKSLWLLILGTSLGTLAVIGLMALLINRMLNRPPEATVTIDEAEMMARATDAFVAEQLPAAVEAFTAVLQQNPNNRTARLLLGRTYLGLGQSALAEQELQQVRSAGENYAAYAVFLAEALLQQGKARQLLDTLPPNPTLPLHVHAELLAQRSQAELQRRDVSAAVQELDAALAIGPETPAVRLTQVRLRLAQQQTTEARQLLSQLLADQPDAATAWSLQGDLALHDGRIDQAEQAYNRALVLRYGPPGDLLNRAVIHIFKGNYPAARADIAMARQRAGEVAGVLFTEGLLALRQGRPHEAWTRLDQARQVAPRYSPIQYYSGLTYLSLGQWKQAETQLRRYLQVDPQATDASLLLACGQILRGDDAAAVDTLQALPAGRPDDADVLELLAYLLLLQDQSQAGIDYLQAVAARRPEVAVLQARLGLILLALGQTRAARQPLEQAVQLAPEQDQMAVLRILGELRNRRFDDALRLTQALRQQRPDSPVPEVLHGLIARATGQPDEARAAFNRALQRQPYHTVATLHVASLAVAGGQVETARQLLNEALQARPDDALLRFHLAELEYREQRLPQAREQLAATLAVRPEVLPLRLWLAELWLQAQQPREAIRLLQRTPGDANDPQVLERLAEAQLAAGEWLDATQTLRNLIWSRPSAKAMYLLAKTYAAQADVVSAQRELNRATTQDPQFWPAQLAQVRYLLAENRLTEALPLANRLRAVLPDDPNVLDLEGDLALGRKDYRSAEDLLRKAMQRFPEDHRWVLKLAQAQMDAGQTDAALQTYRRWLETHPDDAVIQQALAHALFSAGQDDDALAAYRRWLELQPDQPQALHQSAWLLRRREPARALDYARRAVELQPKEAVFRGTLALLLLEQGDNRRAVDTLKPLLNQSEIDSGLQYRFARLLVQAGETATARDSLERLLEAVPAFPERIKVVELLQQLGGGQKRPMMEQAFDP